MSPFNPIVVSPKIADPTHCHPLSAAALGPVRFVTLGCTACDVMVIMIDAIWAELGGGATGDMVVVEPPDANDCNSKSMRPGGGGAGVVTVIVWLPSGSALLMGSALANR